MTDIQNAMFKELGEIKSSAAQEAETAERLKKLLDGHSELLKTDKQFAEHFFSAAIFDFSDLLIPYLADYAMGPEFYGLAAQESQDTWQKVPAHLRASKEFVRGAIKGGYWIYFRLTDQERENEDYARAFIEQCAENCYEIENLSDGEEIPLKVWESNDFVEWAFNHFEETSFFVPEPLRSNASFIKKVMSFTDNPQYGFAFRASEVDEMTGPDIDKYRDFIEAINERARLNTIVQEAAPGRVKGKFKL